MENLQEYNVRYVSVLNNEDLSKLINDLLLTFKKENSKLINDLLLIFKKIALRKKLEKNVNLSTEHTKNSSNPLKKQLSSNQKTSSECQKSNISYFPKEQYALTSRKSRKTACFLSSEKINLLVEGLIAKAENKISSEMRDKVNQFLRYDPKDPKRWPFYNKKNKIISRLKFIIRQDNVLQSMIDDNIDNGANYNPTVRENVVSAVHKQLEKIYDVSKIENLSVFDDKECLEEMKKDICIAKSMKQSNNSKSKISNQNLSKKSII